ncbi:MAG: hypothetical protein AAF556_12675, partial [Pseudomonadota bacterium]
MSGPDDVQPLSSASRNRIGMTGQGGTDTSSSDWISRLAATVLMVGGAALIIVYLLAAQFLPEWRYGRNGEASAFGNSAIGYAGFA